MNRCLQLVVAIVGATLIAAVGSHLLAAWVKIDSRPAHPWNWGEVNGKPPAYLAGSSVADYGIAWDQISTQLGTPIIGWGIAGGSPFEWEQYQPLASEARATFIVISPPDLNDALTCDFRAAIVPITHCFKTLLDAHVNREYWERTLSQYPTTWLRTLFPTLGRSRGLMGKLRIIIAKLIRPSAHVSESDAGPTFGFGKRSEDDEYKREKLSDWPQAKIVGKLTAARVGFRGGDFFAGPRSLALERMLLYAEKRGRTIAIVVPVSRTYAKEFLNPESHKMFEDTLARLRPTAPRVEWLRLDQLPGLSSDDNFCDLVHMNVFGQKIATATLQAWLRHPQLSK